MSNYIGLCMHYDCTNRNSFGYCKTTACINQNYQHEQWISTSNRTDKVVVKPQTNADCIRSMTDEELAEFIGGIFTVERDVWGDYDPRLVVTQEPRVEVRDKEDMMDWLQSPVDGEENGS